MFHCRLFPLYPTLLMALATLLGTSVDAWTPGVPLILSAPAHYQHRMSTRHGDPRGFPHRSGVFVRAATEGASGDATAPTLSARVHEQAIETLKQAVENRKPSAEDVFEALRGLAEETGLPDIMDAEDVEGSWQLVFSTLLPAGYMTMRELVGFYPSRESASVDNTLGPLPMGGLQGHCMWKGGVENELVFTMETVTIGPFKVPQDRTDVKTYRFFFHDGKKVLAAKSSDGGFVLLSRVSGKDKK